MKKTLIFFVVSCLFDCFSQHEHLLRDFGAKCFKNSIYRLVTFHQKGAYRNSPRNVNMSRVSNGNLSYPDAKSSKYQTLQSSYSESTK